MRLGGNHPHWFELRKRIHVQALRVDASCAGFTGPRRPQTELCINGITEVVNSMYQNAVPYLVDPCATVNGIGGVSQGPALRSAPTPCRPESPCG